MRKLILVSMIALTAAASVSAPSFAQQKGGGQSNGGGQSAGNGNTGDYYIGLSRYKNNRRPIYIRHGRSTAYCSTNWAVLHDEYGNRNWVRHCDDRREIDVD